MRCGTLVANRYTVDARTYLPQEPMTEVPDNMLIEVIHRYVELAQVQRLA